jgi:transposase-like protein
MGVDRHGHKHLISLEDGVREPTQGWRELLLSAKNRG